MATKKEVVYLPIEAVPEATVEAWLNAANRLGAAKQAEMALRLAIVKALPEPEDKEGTVTYCMPSNSAVKLAIGYKLNRDVDMAAFVALAEELDEHKVARDLLVKMKPELSVSVYRLLDAEQRQVFDQCLTIKPGTPSFKFTIPGAKNE